MTTNLRHSVRAIILDNHDRMLLCQLDIPKPVGSVVVWAAPGGGVEHGETRTQALRRELDEEVGLALDTDPPHVWHQQVVAPGHAAGYDGVINDYFLVRAASFTPRGSMTAEELAAEYVTDWRWWSWDEIAAYRGPELFSPRDLATPLAALLREGAPTTPLQLGL
jgi:ADP-ribose pyrophosphatase YjhB (NUDIX family)